MLNDDNGISICASVTHVNLMAFVSFSLVFFLFFLSLSFFFSFSGFPCDSNAHMINNVGVLGVDVYVHKTVFDTLHTLLYLGMSQFDEM